ncbi:ABC transporter permease [Acidaminobacter sp. JC074]|uniref:FtsX-like permease family protein n=1 Tax=Acidaminobacter sp. JC074 TaxID=2530199 RepID=UPI001F0FCD4F|nr:FtsX-like permease family protein [Acidaminobacter sp. JC074]MCH4889790.1 ABC transporter permease [Acidaminobacter sp. JC074]
MLFKLALNNIKKSYKDYLIYFLTIAISISLFYMFNSMESQKAMLVLDQPGVQAFDVLTGSLEYVSGFLTFVIAFLMVYANQFLIRRRKKELGIYMTLGMNRLKISMILFVETFLTGIISLIVGIAIGFIGSHFLSIITARMFLVDLKAFRFIFSSQATLKSMIAFGTVFLVVMVLNTFNMLKVQLIDLLYGKKNQKQRVRHPILIGLVFISSLISLAYAYYCITINGMLRINLVFMQAILFGIIGSFLFFYGLAPIFYALIKKVKKIFYYQLNIFSLRQIYSKVNSTFAIMAIISIMLLIAIGTFATGNGTAIAINESLVSSQPFDVSLKLYMDTQVDRTKLPGQSELINIYPSDMIMGDYIDFDTNNDYFDVFSKASFNLIKLSEFNKSRALQGLEPLVLSKEHFVLLYTSDLMDSTYNDLKKMTIHLNESNLTLSHVIKERYLNEMQSDEVGILIVDDSYIESEPYIKIINAFVDDERAFIDQVNTQFNEAGTVSYQILSKKEIIANSLSISVMVTYISIYVGIVFIMASVIILSLQQLSEASDNARRYDLLMKLGVEEKQIKHSILIQISTYFLLPLLLAIVHSYVGISVSSKVVKIFGNLDVFKNILITATFVLAIYGSYFVITYITIKSMVLNKS